MAKENVNRKENEADRELVFTRTFNAPREMVWKMWTDPKLLAKWWGPNGFSITTHSMEFKVGGVWRFIMHGPDGRDYHNKLTYNEIVKHERIVFSHGGEEKELEKDPVGHVTTATFEAIGDQTKVTMRLLFPTIENRNWVVSEYKADEGGKQTMARLAEELEKDKAAPEFVISRIFDAPRELVWKAWTQPELMAKWFGPKGISVVKNTMDLRPGGTYHYCMRTPDGHDMWGKFTYREIVTPEKLVFVNSFSDAKGGITRHPMSPTWPLKLLSTVTLEDVKGKTKLTVHWTPLSASDEEVKTFADGMASMQQGWGGTLEQLEAFLATA